MRSKLLLTLILLSVFVLPLSAQSETIITLSLPEWREDIFENTDILSRFQAEHPGVKVVLAPSADNAFFTPAAYDLDAHLEGVTDYASSADVLYVSSDNLSIEATRAGLFLDLAPLAAGDPQLNEQDFFSSAYESFQWDRGLWGLPVSMDVQIIVYDPAAFDAVGLAYPDEGWTLDDYANADRLLSEYDEDGELIRPGFPVFGSGTVLIRSLLGHGFYDPATVPQQPKFTDPDLETLLASWADYQQEGLLGGAPLSGGIDFNNIPLQLSSPFLLASTFMPRNSGARAGVLLPGGTASLRVEGFGVSGGTQQPELAYELVKFLSNDASITNAFFAVSPARRSLVGAEADSDETVFRPEFSDDVQQIIDEALENAIPTSEMRYANYVDRIVSLVAQDNQDLNSVLSTMEAEAVENLQIAAERRSTTVVAVATPAPTPVLSAGEVALNFGITSFTSSLPNRDRWDQVIDEFTRADPEVRQITLDSDFTTSLSQIAEQNDCFYLPFNQTDTTELDAILSLDPFMDADPNFDAADIIGNVMAQVETNNQTWAYPLNIQPSVLWYNSDSFASAGIAAPEDGWSADAFTDALQSLKVAPDDPVPFQPREFGGNYILMLAAAYGGLPLDYRTQPVTVNYADPATVEALRQVLDLAKAGYIQYQQLANIGGGIVMGGGSGGGGGPQIPIYNETLNQFSFQRFQFSGNPENAYRLTSYPAGSQYTPVTYAIGTGYISAFTPAPDACYRWLATLAEHPELFSAMPARRSQLNNAELGASLGVDLSNFYRQFESLLQSPNVIEFPSVTGGITSPTDFITQYWLNRAMDRYVLEDADLETELADADVFAKDYQTCTANLPAFDQSASQQDQLRYARQIFDCAGSVDPSMESELPQLPEID